MYRQVPSAQDKLFVISSFAFRAVACTCNSFLSKGCTISPSFSMLTSGKPHRKFSFLYHKTGRRSLPNHICRAPTRGFNSMPLALLQAAWHGALSFCLSPSCQLSSRRAAPCPAASFLWHLDCPTRTPEALWSSAFSTNCSMMPWWCCLTFQFVLRNVRGRTCARAGESLSCP